MRSLLIISGLTLFVSCAIQSETQVNVSAANDDSNAVTADAVGSAEDAEQTESKPMTETSTGLYALHAETLDAESLDLSQYAGKVTLVVNVASRCGYTKQYKGLQELHEELGEQGFAVLGFPSNEFGAQEPGSAAEIREFCSTEFGVTFPMFAKCEVKSSGGQSPIYGFLEDQTGEAPNWNFCKYLIGKDGQVISFYKSSVAPDDAELRTAIETALG